MTAIILPPKPSVKPFIAIVNLSTVWSDDNLAAYVSGPLQKHVSNDLGPAWNVDADLGVYVDHTAIPPGSAWVIAIVDDEDHNDVLGLHDVTAAGLPLGHVNAKAAMASGGDPRIDLGHEADEMLVNPKVNRFWFTKYEGVEIETVIEVCDAVQDDSVAIKVDGVPVTNAVLPTFFDADTPHPAGTKFDLGGVLKAPMTLASGGYISINNILDGQGWRQAFEASIPAAKREFPPRYSRRERLFLRENHKRPFVPSTLV